MKLNGNKILITGARSGIGTAILEEFLSLDNQIIALGCNDIKLSELAKKDSRIIPFRVRPKLADRIMKVTM